MIKLPAIGRTSYSLLSLIPTHELDIRDHITKATMGRRYSQDSEERQWVLSKDSEDSQEATQPRELERKGRMAKEKDD